MIKSLSFGCALALCASSVFAQSLSPEDIERMLDEEAEVANPYAVLLNNPDPSRSLGAMRIMMESGDPQLVDLALEFGLLSSDAAVRRQAVEHYVATGPYLSLVFDASNVEDNDVFSTVRSQLGGNFDADNLGYSTFKVGPYDPKQECYIHDGQDYCAVRFNASGIFIQGRTVNAKVNITETGQLVGQAELSRVDDLVPLTVNLLD